MKTGPTPAPKPMLPPKDDDAELEALTRPDPAPSVPSVRPVPVEERPTAAMFPFVPPPPGAAAETPALPETAAVLPPSVIFAPPEAPKPFVHDYARAQSVEFPPDGSVNVPPGLGFEQVGTWERATTIDRVRNAFKAKSIDVLEDGAVRVTEESGAWFRVHPSPGMFVAG